MLSVTNPTSYDIIPYSSKPFPQTHPNRLAIIGKLFGMDVQPVTNCRVLELGCGRGGNLIPMASYLPESHFVGVDLSSVQIGEAAHLSSQLCIDNIEFRHANILDVGSEIGTFDYIIVHGVYSWVPQEVRDKILKICQTQLNRNGVAYVSYNTYPGWNMRSMIRDIVQYHTDQFEEPQLKIRESRELLDFFAKHAPPKTPFGQFLVSEVESLRYHEDTYLFHEHLEEFNEPVFFHEFARRANAAGLQYLGESDIASMYNCTLPEEITDRLDRVARTLVQKEQYLDFLRNRMFRQTLLCHDSLVPDRTLGLSDLHQVFISSSMQPVRSTRRDGSPGPVEFKRGGLRVTVGTPLLQASLLELARVYPVRLTFEEMVTRARTRFDSRRLISREEYEQENQDLARDVLQMYVSGAIELHACDGPFVAVESERPFASSYARYQAEHGEFVTSAEHQVVGLNLFERRLLGLLDGNRTSDQLATIVQQWIDCQELQLQQPSEGSSLQTTVPEALRLSFERLRRLGLLIRSSKTHETTQPVGSLSNKDLAKNAMENA